MAVTLSENDLTAPQGRLQSAMFPDGDMSTNVTAWLNKATTTVQAADIDSADHDAAAEAYVYWRAYEFVAERMLAEPEQYTDEDGESRTLSTQQISSFQRLAERFRDEYESYINDRTVRDVPASASVRISPRW